MLLLLLLFSTFTPTLSLSMATPQHTPLVRAASHAGTWYSSDPSVLANQLSSFLSSPPNLPQPSSPPPPLPVAQFTPHAGYSYSGSCAGAAFQAGLSARLASSSFSSSSAPSSSSSSSSSALSTIFVLHPSHHLPLNGVGISIAAFCATPLTSSNLPVDRDLLSSISSALASAGVAVTELSLAQDEREHSAELEYPFIAHLLEASGSKAMIVPLMIGSNTPASSKAIGVSLAPFLFAPSAFSVVSSDFCHWGARFQYTPFLSEGSRASPSSSIGSLITALDQEGMAEITRLSPSGFAAYADRTGNTICGRRVVEVLLFANEAMNEEENEVRWFRYEKSSEVKGAGDASVSYAGGVLYRHAGSNERETK